MRILIPLIITFNLSLVLNAQQSSKLSELREEYCLKTKISRYHKELKKYKKPPPVPTAKDLLHNKNVRFFNIPAEKRSAIFLNQYELAIAVPKAISSKNYLSRESYQSILPANIETVDTITDILYNYFEINALPHSGFTTETGCECPDDGVSFYMLFLKNGEVEKYIGFPQPYNRTNFTDDELFALDLNPKKEEKIMELF